MSSANATRSRRGSAARAAPQGWDEWDRGILGTPLCLRCCTRSTKSRFNRDDPFHHRVPSRRASAGSTHASVLSPTRTAPAQRGPSDFELVAVLVQAVHHLLDRLCRVHRLLLPGPECLLVLLERTRDLRWLVPVEVRDPVRQALYRVLDGEGPDRATRAVARAMRDSRSSRHQAGGKAS